jgi:ATP/maltotriose-dependent transcriptional regulator MalT
VVKNLPFVTKLILPQRKRAILSRPRLLAFLHEYLDRKLILVSAAAGYGKTTLLVDFAHDTELPICWYSLDASDRDPRVFLAYLLGSLQRQFPQFGSRTEALLSDPNSAQMLDHIAGTLVTEIHDDIASYFALVLDDYHLVDASRPVNQILDNLLSYLPDNAHIILASRTVPAQLTLTRLTARMQVTGLGSSDLRFTADEIRELIKQNYSLDITEAAARQLADQSEGWVASIVLTTPTLWQGLFKDWVKTRGAGSQVFEYLATEVFAQQPEMLRVFLEETSVLDQMNAGLCNELIGITDAQARLDALEARNLFISHLEEGWYRYHYLFHEFLKTHLARTRPERLRALLARAAELFEQRGLLSQAIAYRLESAQFEQAARVIEMCIEELYDQGRWDTLIRWIDALPAPILQARPGLLLWRGKIHTQVGELAEALLALEQAHAEFERRGDRTNLARVLIEEAIVVRFQGQTSECIQKCQDALAIVETHEFALIAQAHRTIGVALAAQGDVRGSIAELERALALYQLANDRHNTGLVENDLGAAQTMIGNRTQATRHFENALGYWRKLGNSAAIANTLNNIGVGHYYAGAFDQAQAILEEALKESRRAGTLRVEGYVLASLGDVYRALGDWERALKADTDAFQIAERIREALLLTFTLAGLSHTWRLVGDLKMAEQLSLNAAEGAREHRSDYELALAGTALGAVRLAQGDYDEALTWLEHALQLSEQHAGPHEAGRVHYFLSLVYFRRKQYAQAILHLQALAVIGQNLQEDGGILPEMARELPLLQFVLKRRVETKYFRQLRKKLAKMAGQSRPLTQVIEPTWPRVEVATLGSAEVVSDGHVIQRSEWQTEATKELLLFFAVHPQPWRKEQIMAALWPDKSVAHANDMFHSSIYRIRRALYPEILLYRDGKYQLNPEARCWVDVREFEELLEKAASPAGESRVVILRQALALYRGDFLEELYSDWANQQREILREKYMAGLLQLAAYERREGRFDQAIALYQAALEKDNQREQVYQALMTAYWEQGERTQALQIYQKCLQTLAEELGVPPMPETIALYEQILESR